MTMFSSSDTRSNISGVARALADRAEQVAAAFFGEPSQISRHELRWGRHGSVSLRRSGTKRGFWYDHEHGQGGDLLHLIARERNVRLSEAVTIAEQEFVGVSAIAPPRIERRLPAALPDDSEVRARAARRIWSESGPFAGGLADRYFIQHRRLDIRLLDLGHSLRWHAGIHAVVALMTDPISGDPTGIHRTFLDADGAKLERKMLGRQGVVRLSPDVAVTMALGITEGIEDGIAVLLSGWSPVWAATSAGALARLPAIAGIEALTIFADADQAGRQAADTCRTRWFAHGCDVHVAFPTEGAP